MRIKFHKIHAAIFALLLLCSCSRSYTGQFFSFPPGSKPHENDWTYLCKIIVWDPLGKSGTAKGNRKVQIFIHDKNKNNVLHDDLEFESAFISSKIKWERLESITLDLYEEGNQYAEDDYNKQLIKAGPKHLITLVYTWDGAKYVKSGTEQRRQPDSQ